MKLKKGSAEAKKFMASIRAKKKGAKKKLVKENIPDRKYQKITLDILPIKKLSGNKKIEKGGIKKAPVKKRPLISKHKDTKSHNVKISVVSGLKNDVLSKLNNTFKKIDKYTDMKNTYSKMSKNKTIQLEDRKHYKYMYNVSNKHLLSLKKEIILLKKLL